MVDENLLELVKYLKFTENRIMSLCDKLGEVENNLSNGISLENNLYNLSSALKEVMATKDDLRTIKREFRGISLGRRRQGVSFAGENYAYNNIEGFESDPCPASLYEQPYL